MNNKFISFQAASELSASSAVASVSAAHGAACSDDTVIFLFGKGRDDTVGIEVVVILPVTAKLSLQDSGKRSHRAPHCSSFL